MHQKLSVKKIKEKHTFVMKLLGYKPLMFTIRQIQFILMKLRFKFCTNGIKINNNNEIFTYSVQYKKKN